jgi:hypothetical protein
VGFLHGVGGGLTSITGATTITNPGAECIFIQNAAASNGVTFANVSCTQSGATGVRLVTNAAPITFADLDIAPDANIPALLGTDNTATITTTSGTLNATTANAIQISGASTASRTPLAMVLDSVTSSGGTTNLSLTNVSGSLAMNAGALTAASGAAFSVTGSTATVSYAGAITNAGSGIVLTNNTGGAIAFTGGMALNTGANAAFTATGGGTVSATQNNTSIVNTLATTTATALDIANTTIGAAGLTFRSISVGTAASGPANGISVVNAGSGGLTVSGTSTTAGSGGAIQRTTTRAGQFVTSNNITLQNMTFNNNVTSATSPTASNGTCGNHAGGGNSTSCHAVLHFDTVTGVTLTNITIDGTVKSSLGDGINGNNVTNMSLTQVNVLKAGDENDEEGLKLVGISGTLTLDRCNFQGNQSRGLYAEPFTGPTTVAVSGGVYGDNVAFGANGQQGILVVFRDTSSGSVTVQKDINGVGTLFQNINNHAISVQNVTNGGALSFNISDATFVNDNAAIDMPNSNAAGTYTFNVLNNQMPAIVADATVMNAFNTSAATQQGTISGNVIGQAGVAGSGCNVAGCGGIRLTQQGINAGLLKVAITNNSIHRIQESGIFGIANAGPGKMSLTITGNTITDSDNVGGSAIQPIHLESGASAGNTNLMCVRIGCQTAGAACDASGLKNSLSGAAWLAGVRLRQVVATATVKLSGMGASTPSVYLPTVNTMSGAAAGVSVSGTVVDDGTACP